MAVSSRREIRPHEMETFRRLAQRYPDLGQVEQDLAELDSLRARAVKPAEEPTPDRLAEHERRFHQLPSQPRPQPPARPTKPEPVPLRHRLYRAFGGVAWRLLGLGIILLTLLSGRVPHQEVVLGVVALFLLVSALLGQLYRSPSLPGSLWRLLLVGLLSWGGTYLPWTWMVLASLWLGGVALVAEALYLAL